MFVKSSTWLNKWCSWLYKDSDMGLFYGEKLTLKLFFAIRFYWSQGSSSYSKIKLLITNKQAYMESASTKLCWFPPHDNTLFSNEGKITILKSFHWVRLHVGLLSKQKSTVWQFGYYITKERFFAMSGNNVKVSRCRRLFPSAEPALRGECYKTLLSIHEQRNPLSALHQYDSRKSLSDGT